MDRRLLQILNNTSCLSKNQLQGYMNDTLQPEEVYAVEMHLIECPICNDALEGLKAGGAGLEPYIISLQPPSKLPPQKGSNKEKKLFEIKNITGSSSEKNAGSKPAHTQHTAEDKAAAPVIVNSEKETIIPSRSVPMPTPPRKGRWVRAAGIAAAVILGFGSLWYFELFNSGKQESAADSKEVVMADSGNLAADSNALAITDNKEVKSDAMIATADSSAPDTAKVTAVTRDSRFVVPAPDKAANTADKKAVAEKSVANVEKKEAVSKEEIKKGSDEKDERPKEEPVSSPVETKKAEKPAEKKETTDKTSDFDNGMALYKKQQYGNALIQLMRARRDAGDPNHYEAIYYSALSYQRMGNNQKAIELFRKLVKEGAPQKRSAQKQLKALGEK